MDPEWPLVHHMMSQAVSALVWLHRDTTDENEAYCGAHGDVKAENILVTTNFVVKVSRCVDLSNIYLTNHSPLAYFLLELIKYQICDIK